jgi:hypothetical protein
VLLALGVAVAPRPASAVPPVSATSDDEVPSRDPVADRRRARAIEIGKRLRLRDEMTPWYVPAMKYGGISLAIVGTVGVFYSWWIYDAERTSEADFQELLTINDVSWVLLAVGSVAYGSSYLYTPGLPDTASPAPGTTDVGMGADGSVRFRVRF